MRGLILVALLAFCTSASAQEPVKQITWLADGTVITTTYPRTTPIPVQPPPVYRMPTAIYEAPVYSVPVYDAPVFFSPPAYYAPRYVEVRRGVFGRTRVTYR